MQQTYSQIDNSRRWVRAAQKTTSGILEQVDSHKQSCIQFMLVLWQIYFNQFRFNAQSVLRLPGLIQRTLRSENE